MNAYRAFGCMFCTSCGAIWTILLLINPIWTAGTCDIKAETSVRRSTKLEGFKFWYAKTGDIGACARCCVRRKICVSFNFDLQSQICELNWETLANRPDSKTQSTTNVYSDISVWPKNLDPNCYERPCASDEVCFPGSLADGKRCAFSCLKLRIRCPKPRVGIVSGLTMNSVATFTCPRGSLGGDNSTCLPTHQWSKELNTTCVPVFGHACTTDADCDSIGAVCDSSKCACAASHIYNETAIECQEGVRLVDGGLHSGRLEIWRENEWHPVCRDHWDWKATHVLCKQLFGTPHGGSSHRNTAFGSGVGKGTIFKDIQCNINESSIFDCTIGEIKLEDCNTDRHMGITCFTEAAVPYDLRLVDDTANDMSGRLEIQHNGNWGTVCGRGWGDKQANVACKTLNANWRQKSHCKNACNGEGILPIMTSEVKCDDDEPRLRLCRNDGWGESTIKDGCTHGDDVGLECEIGNRTTIFKCA